MSTKVAGLRNFAIGIALVLAATLTFGLLGRQGEDTSAARTESVQVPAAVGQSFPGSADAPDAMGNDGSDYIELLVRGLPTDGCEHRQATPHEELSPEERQELDESLKAVSESLSDSDDPSLLLASALLNGDPEHRWQRVNRVLASSPQNPVALWHQLQYCDKVGCDREAIELAATTFDESNGMVWLAIGSERIRAGKWNEAAEALRRAATSPRFDTYFIDYVLVIERGLAATTDRAYSDRVTNGIGVAAAMAIPSFGDISRACQSDENDPLIWVDLCNELGAQMSDVARELITSMIGYGYRRAAATRTGDEVVAEQLRKTSRRIFDNVMRNQATAGTQVLLQNDPAVMQDYVENFLAHGEIAAMGLLVNDARRLRENPDYDQCNFVGDPGFNL